MPDAIVFKKTSAPPMCTKCAYLLQGLTEPRCPECGQAFDPADITTYSTPWPRASWGEKAGWTFTVILTVIVAAALERDPGPWSLVLLAVPLAAVVRVGFYCRLLPTILYTGLVICCVMLTIAIGLGSVQDLFAPTVFAFSLIAVLAFLLAIGSDVRRRLKP